MPTLIDRQGRRDDQWIDAPAQPADTPAGASVLLSPSDWQTGQDAWRAHAARIGIRLQPSDDPATIAGNLDQFSLIAVVFPAFTDGRGYSIARLLRERHGWRGELRATGEVLRDQLLYMARCGFDTFALSDGESVDACLAAFADFTESYQGGVDRSPLYARRHGQGAPT